MNCTEGPVEIIEGYDIHTVIVKNGEVKLYPTVAQHALLYPTVAQHALLYSVNDYCAHGDLYAFEKYSNEESVMYYFELFLQPKKCYQVLHFCNNGENEYYVSIEILMDFIAWCKKRYNL